MNQIILLPNSGAACIGDVFKHTDSYYVSYNRRRSPGTICINRNPHCTGSSEHAEAQHLYKITDKPIAVGDYIIGDDIGYPRYYPSLCLFTHPDGYLITTTRGGNEIKVVTGSMQKILSTTNPALIKLRPSLAMKQSAVVKFVRDYNRELLKSLEI